MADPRGFLRTRVRELPVDRSVAIRIQDWCEVHPSRPEGETGLAMVQRQAARCMDCGVPFCHFSCPLGNAIPDWNDLVFRGHWDEALERLHATNNFPEFTGRLCPAPCEAGCVLGITDPAVTIKNVEVSLIEEGFARGFVSPKPAVHRSGRSVAVVGSGPAGLAAAQQLTRAGHQVTVFERSDRVGGLLRYGIPEFKMEKSVIDRRVEQMASEGTTFVTGVEVGTTLPVAELRNSFDAIVVTVGSTVPRDLPIPGRDLAGVLQAMDYLVPANHAAVGDIVRHQPVATDKDVVVIGGGDTGADCVGTATRQGARSVTQLEIMPRPPQDRPESQPWPTYPMLYKVTSAHEEGGQRIYQVGTQSFMAGDRGQVRGLNLMEVQFVEGRPVPIEGSQRTLAADLVVLAMGFTGPEFGPLLTELGVERTARGVIARDGAFATSVPGVFAAGDAGRGQSLIVWAIAEGRAAAASVDLFLTGQTALPAPVRPDSVSLRV